MLSLTIFVAMEMLTTLHNVLSGPTITEKSFKRPNVCSKNLDHDDLPSYFAISTSTPSFFA